MVKENPDILEDMDFNGTWQVYAQENYEEFLRAMGKKNKPEYKDIYYPLKHEHAASILICRN